MKVKSAKPDKESKAISGLKHELQELSVLLEISSAVTASLDLEKTMERVLSILHEKMGMERGTLTLLDTKTNELSIEVAHGISAEQVRLGRYRLGEGIIGRVVAAGEPMIIPNVGKEPLFLDRTKSRGDLKRNTIAYLCVPINLEQKTIGALSVDRLFGGHVALEEDLRLLTIISSIVAQAVRIHQMVQKEREKLEKENTFLKRELKSKFRPANIIGQSKRMTDVYASIELVSQSQATVLLRGESGTGKELVANAIHYNSSRSDKPFVKVSCAALPESLLESELFGYEKGAFTGAVTSKLGRFEMANSGTLFLDEIGDISPSTQIKLLRVLQEKEFEKVGGTETLRVNIRLITATNQDLEELVRTGKFREDLYYRLNVIPIFLPPLRERREDIPILFNHFLKLANQENGKDVKYIADEAMEYLMNYSWPGNIRELENAVTRSVIMCKGDTITLEVLPIPGNKTHPVLQGFKPPEPLSTLEDKGAVPAQSPENLPEAVERVEQRMIRDALVKTKGNQRQAAKLLGVTERILGYKIKNYGIVTT
ncbi:MAG: nif-specific transcriptional activator NifA [Candidatus Omnitrophica bacterium]|nr:nif-specific transcriptional activator NifA [Candidatus Omnitrophota bacterium]